MTRLLPILPAAALFALASAPLRAQAPLPPVADAPADVPAAEPEAVNPLTPGAWSLAFDVPVISDYGGSGTFGVWRMIGTRTNLGLAAGLRVNRRERTGDAPETGEDISVLSLGLQARHYVGGQRVVPFIHGGVSGFVALNENSVETASAEYRGTGASGRAGIGAEWFPVPQVGIVGITGLEVGLFRREIESQNANGPAEHRETDAYAQTFTSRLAVQIYF